MTETHKRIKNYNVSVNNIRYATEKILVKECHPGGPGNMVEIFADAIKNKVIYIKFGLTNEGVPRWAAKVDVDYLHMDKVCFRPQSGFDYTKGKLGLDPK